MASSIDNQQPSRKTGSLLPELFDTIEHIYPEGGTTIVKVYSFNGYIVGMIQETYADDTRCLIVKEERLPLGV